MSYKALESQMPSLEYCLMFGMRPHSAAEVAAFSCMYLVQYVSSAEPPLAVPCMCLVQCLLIQVHCPQVRECLLALPQKKWVFTNCNEKHAKLALETLQLQVIHLLMSKVFQLAYIVFQGAARTSSLPTGGLSALDS